MKPPNRHLQRRMKDREVSQAEIEEGIANPSITYPSEDHDDRTVILADLPKTPGSPPRRLKIVVVTADPDTVITVGDRDMEG